MPSREGITKERYNVRKRMLYRLLGESGYLGVGYVLQLVYESAVVVMSYEAGSEYALDKYVRNVVPDYKALVVARNVLNHNSYSRNDVEYMRRLWR